MRLAVGIEYLGAAFSGWQCQAGVRTVQACVEAAIGRVADHSVCVVTAGRTDTGVHASGQVVHFDTHSQRDQDAWLRGGNTFLPSDVSLLWVRPVAEQFHARFTATSRAYRYIILNRRTRPALYRDHAAWDYRRLDVDRMQRAALSLMGKHDFAAFQAAGCQAKSTTRNILQLDVERHGDWVCIDIRADAFLQRMVRNLVGVLTAIGAGEQTEAWAGTVLGSRDRRQGGVTAPAAGLYLSEVRYPERFAIPPAPPRCRFW